jgi:hypothetical protein
MITNPMEEAAQQSTEWFKTASHEEFMALLKVAGVLDENGQVAERYRPPGAPPRGQPVHAVAGGSQKKQ